MAFSQESYIKKILEWFNMQNCKLIDTPIMEEKNLTVRMCSKTLKEIRQMERVPYSSARGSLMYAIMCTRPDISFAIGMVSRYQLNPDFAH